MSMKFTKGMLMTALITGSVLWGGTAVFAEENVGEFELDTMVVTANRYEKRDVDIPASTEVFDQERLAATGASNVYEAMQFASGLELHQYGPGGSSMGNMSSKIAIRGNANGTLVLVNGIPLNTRGTYDLADFPVENIERVEVVRGGGAVLYGSEATGGVINIITKKKRANFVKAAWGNYNQQEYSGSFQADRLGFSYKYTNRGTTDNVTSDKKDWKGPENNNFNLSYQFNDRLSLSASHNESNYHYISSDSSATDTRQKVKRNNFQLTYDDNSFKATAYYVDRNREKDALHLVNYKSKMTGEDWKAGQHDMDEENNKNFGIDLQKVWNVNTNDTFLLGANFKEEQYTPDGGSMQSRHNYSAYASYEKKFDAKNILNLSARESWTAGAPNDLNNSNFSGQVQYTYKPEEDVSIYASVGQSYKMPDLHQIYNKGVKQLDPQTGMHYELGVKKDIDEHRSARLALFSYKVEDNITATWKEKKNKFEYKNEDLKNTGIEAEYRLTAAKGFGYNVAITYGNPKSKSIADDGSSAGWLREYSRWELKSGLTYRMDKFKAALNASYMADRYVSNIDTKPALVTNLNAEYEVAKNGSVFMSINNIFDRREDVCYRSDKASYYYTPVNFLIGLKYSF